ncbi:hypothetical protein ASZ78_015001, partial [Callipepla squamata]
RFAKHFYSSEKTDFILTALQGMSDCSNYSTQLAATLMDVLIVDFKPAPTDVQRIVMAIHRSRKLITEERAQKTIQNTFPWLAASDPRATTLSLLRCSHTCDKDTWELWEMALSSAGVVPWMVQELLRLLEVAPLGQETEIGTLPLAAAMALHKILQHSQYGPQVCLFVLELFVALIFQMVSSTSLKPLEVTAVMEDPSTPTSASRILVKVVHKLLQCADLDRLVQAMDRHKLWRQLLGAATWQDGLRSLARVMVMECRVDSMRIFSHVQKLLWYHQLQWREVPAMVFYMEVQRIVMAIHRSRKLITEERAQKTIQNTFPWLAASDPRATTLSLLRCSHTCDKDTWELWEMALSSAGVVPWMVQELLRLLEVAPLGQETEIGTLPLAAAMALHKILQHSQYGPQVCLFVLELFVALIFQMVSSTSLKPLEVTAVMEDPSTPTSASRILVKVVHKLLQCADLDRLVQAMDRHKLWRQLLGAATWQDGLRSLARVMVMECRVDSMRIFSHVQKLLWYHQLQWREVPAMVFYMEVGIGT